MTSDDFWLAGNTRFPRSVTVFKPFLSKIDSIIAVERIYRRHQKLRIRNDARQKFFPVAFVGNVATTFSGYVKFLPRFSFLSASVTSKPRSASVPAAISPAGPAPITRIFIIKIKRSFGRFIPCLFYFRNAHDDVADRLCGRFASAFFSAIAALEGSAMSMPSRLASKNFVATCGNNA